MMLPKEHGAYGQLAAPLVTALAAGGITAPALAVVATIVLGFLAHEPWLVLRGARGTRAQRDHAPAARRWLVALITAAAAAGVVSVVTTPQVARWGLAVPLLPALVVASATVRGRERQAIAEVCVALTFSLAAVPVCLAAGATATTAVSVALPFAVLFSAGTLAVRSVTLAARDADARLVTATRVAAILVALGGTAALTWAARAGVLSWAAPLAAVPGAAVSAALAVAPTSARHLRTIGWLLMAAAVMAAAVVTAW